MATNIVDISLAVVTKLQGVGKLNGVYAYEPDKPSSGNYPFATVTAQAFDGQFGDTIRNIRTFDLVVRVYQERIESNFGNEKAERVMREMVDEILTAFDADTTLSGTCKMVKPISGNLSYEDREMGDTRIAEIVVQATTVVPSTT